MDLQEMGWGEGGGMYCIDLTQDKDSGRELVTAVMNLLVP